MSESAVAHFFGGPLDGRVQAIPDASWRLTVPTLGEVRLTALGPEETIPTRDYVYERRGAVLAGHAYYDHRP